MPTQRNTKQRQLILETVRNRMDHPSADQIYLEVRSKDNKISRGTVYRNLNLLSRNGELQHVKVPGVDRFDCRLDFHCHMYCTRCGQVCDAPSTYSENADREIEKLTGYHIDHHRIVFEGICPDCIAHPELHPQIEQEDAI